MYDVHGKRSPINKSLFEVWSVSLAKYSLEALTRHKDEIIAEFVKVMIDDYAFGKVISQATGSVSSVDKRFRTIEDLLRKVIK